VLCVVTDPACQSNAGSVTDGEDHLWLGDNHTLTNGLWGSLWEDPVLTVGKHQESSVGEASSFLEVLTDTASNADQHSDISGSEDKEVSGSFLLEFILNITSKNSHQVEKLQVEACRILAQWVKSAEAIEAQIGFANPIWLRSFVTRIGKSIDNFSKSIQGV
jgi:hypothetical protein